jgi:hypothetical protein
VGIQTAPAISVFNHHHISVALIPAGENNSAGCRRFDRSAAGRGYVYALMKSVAAVNRVNARSERRPDRPAHGGVKGNPGRQTGWSGRRRNVRGFGCTSRFRHVGFESNFVNASGSGCVGHADGTRRIEGLAART